MRYQVFGIFILYIIKYLGIFDPYTFQSHHHVYNIMTHHRPGSYHIQSTSPNENEKKAICIVLCTRVQCKKKTVYIIIAAIQAAKPPLLSIYYVGERVPRVI